MENTYPVYVLLGTAGTDKAAWAKDIFRFQTKEESQAFALGLAIADGYIGVETVSAEEYANATLEENP